MRKIALAVAVLVSALVTVPAFAGMGKGHHGMGPMGMKKKFASARVLEHGKHLKLTADQRTAITAIRDDSRKAAKDWMKTKMKPAGMAYGEAIKSLDMDKADQAADQMGAAIVAMMKLHNDDMRKTVAKLTPEQQEKMKKKIAKKMKMMRERMSKEMGAGMGM